MLLVIALALQTQIAVPAAHPPATARDSAAKIKLLVRARREETIFFYQWRWEWEKARDFIATDTRLFSLHCHGDGSMGSTDALHLIATPYSRKAMCPIWFQGYGVNPQDEAIAIDNGLRPDARQRIRSRRAALLSLLDSAAVLAPDDPWLIGQRVRLNIDQREVERALGLATDECKLADSYCALLVGYALASSGDRHGADAAYEYAASLMTPKDRCAFLDIRVFLDSENRDSYEKLPCAAQDAINARFWWLADPLFMQPGNERLAVHLYRETLILLHSAVTVDERFDWRVKVGGSAVAEMILRYGWPAVEVWNREQDDNHFGWLGFRDSSVNASREYLQPRFHTTPTYAAATDLRNLTGTDLADVAPKWNQYRQAWDEDWWPVEHFARGGSLGTFDYQVAMFRRANGSLVALAADPRSSLLPDSVLPAYTAALVAMSNPTDSARRAVAPAAVHASGAMALSVETVPGLQVLSAEVLMPDRDSAPAARARFAITAPPGLAALGPRELALSDPALFLAPMSGDALPGSAEDGIERMLPSTDLRGSPRIGVFFEIYGVAPQEELEETLTVSQNEHPGLLRRLGARIGLADLGEGSIILHWRGVQPGMASSTLLIGNTPVRANVMVLDLSRLQPGRYAMEIGIARPGEASVVSHREFTIRGK
jgi:hypothetical protein